jgi:hypothetical protein
MILIAQIILVISFLGIAVFLYRKIPVLVELPEVKNISEPEISKLGEEEMTAERKEELSFHVFLEKVLRRVKILTLKIENKTSNWIEELGHQNKNKNFNDNYWEELKKINRSNKKNK